VKQRFENQEGVSAMKPDFSQIVWGAPGLFRAGSQVFQMQTLGTKMEHSADGFVIYKELKHFEGYSEWWPDGFAPAAVLELGIWAGGSVVFWNEMLRPNRLAALDIRSAESIGSESLARLARYANEQPALRLYWNASQDDAVALERILDDDFPNGIDLVIDDASHLYNFSRSSFEIVFPRVRPGGWYIIEDWSWDVADPFPGQEFLLRSGPPLSLLIRDLALISGTEKNVIDAFEIRRTLAFIQRGAAELRTGQSLSDHLPTPKVKDLTLLARRIASHMRGKGW
jgi:cephalosporin hydroxylase